jgi:hypothetical protein
MHGDAFIGMEFGDTIHPRATNLFTRTIVDGDDVLSRSSVKNIPKPENYAY